MLTKRQHYVPRLYLKKFSQLKNDKVNYYDKIIKKKLTNMHVDNVAQQSYFYDLSEDFINEIKSLKDNEFDERLLDKQYLEKCFSKLETNFGVTSESVINKVNSCEDPFSLTVINYINIDEKKDLATFIALQSIRTPAYRMLGKNFFKFMNKLIPSIFDSLFTDELSENEILFGYLSTGALDRLSAHFTQNFQWYIGIIDKPEQAKNENVRKTFVTDEFLISDNPIINMKHVEKKNPKNVHLEICLPLTPKYILILREPHFPENFINSIVSMHRNDIRIYNEYQYRFSYRKVIYSKPENGKKIEKFFKTAPLSYSNNVYSFCVIEY